MEPGAPSGHPAIATAARVIGGLAAATWVLPLVGALVSGDHTEDGSLAESIGVGLLTLTVAARSCALGEESKEKSAAGAGPVSAPV